jgi:hypothetical protein
MSADVIWGKKYEKEEKRGKMLEKREERGKEKEKMGNNLVI